MKSLFPVILCGGSGTRLWPLSRATLPKQFLPLISSRTMLQETALLFEAGLEFHASILVCSTAQRFVAAEQMREIGVRPFVHLLEPIGRNTAPAAAVAAFAALEEDPEALLMVLPADLLIKKVTALRHAVAGACKFANGGKLVTFGITPTFAETGYGYIRRGRKLGEHEASFEIARFVNKPDAPVAKNFLQDGNYLWNSGMFVFKASRYLEELDKFRPEILEATREAWLRSARSRDFTRLDEHAFAASPSEAIDYAVMEKTGDGVVVESDIGWSDIGSWKALAQAGQGDSAGNVVRGDVHNDGVSNCYVHAESRLIAAVGVENLIIVETPDAVLVTHMDYSQAVNRVVDYLKASQRKEHLTHKRNYCPWGYHEELDANKPFLVMHIMVNPGSEHFFQSRSRRTDHWVVVSGTARITCGKEIFLLSENESTSVPAGIGSRLENVGKMPLHLIKVQPPSDLNESNSCRGKAGANKE